MNSMLKNIFIVILFVSLFTTCLLAWGYSQRALLVLDMKNIEALPKRFRMVDENVDIGNVNATGFKDLHIAGSAQFSAASMPKILEALHTKHLTIIDLRQESHGFLNGNAISWYGKANAQNRNKTAAQIEKKEFHLLARLAQRTQVIVYTILQKTNDERIAETDAMDMPVENVYSEAQFAKEHNLPYYRIYGQDFHAPEPEEVDRFIRIVRELRSNDWIYFHCRAGVGRTTTFMTMYDMMKNAKQVPLDEILARQTAIGGKDLVKLPDKTDFKYEFALKRLEFIRKFYQYAQTNDDNFATSWTEYLKRNN